MRFWNALNGKAWLNNATKFGHGDLLCDLCDGAVEVILKIWIDSDRRNLFHKLIQSYVTDVTLAAADPMFIISYTDISILFFYLYICIPSRNFRLHYFSIIYHFYRLRISALLIKTTNWKNHTSFGVQVKCCHLWQVNFRFIQNFICRIFRYIL